MSTAPGRPIRVALVAGKVKIADVAGHHDYAAGMSLLAHLLEQTPGVSAALLDPWLAAEADFTSIDALVCYSGGGDKHPFFASPQGRERFRALIEQGVGVTMIHQAVRCPAEHAAAVSDWLGGVHVGGESSRGHWPSRHCDFPAHPITRGVAAWEIRDGWLNGIRFSTSRRGLTPLLWSSAAHCGDCGGGDADVVAWAYERDDGGRSFCFTGLDAHAAWSVRGLRQLVVNGALWSAGLPIPAGGAACELAAETATSFLTPRRPPLRATLRAYWQRALRGA